MPLRSPQTDPASRSKRSVAAYFRFVLHNESAIRLLLDSTLPYDLELADAMRRVDDTIARAIRPLIQADIDPDHQRVLAAAVVGMAKGVTRDWLYSHRTGAPPYLRRHATPTRRCSRGGWRSSPGRGSG